MEVDPSNFIESRLRQLRRRVLLVTIVWLSVPPVCIFIGTKLNNENATIAAVLALLPVLAYSSYWVNASRCPRCNATFFGIGMRPRFLYLTCVKCGLSLFAKRVD